MTLGKPIRPPPPPPGPEWVPCGKEREINTRTGMKRTAIKANEVADLGFGLPNIFHHIVTPVEDEDNT